MTPGQCDVICFVSILAENRFIEESLSQWSEKELDHSNLSHNLRFMQNLTSLSARVKDTRAMKAHWQKQHDNVAAAEQ